MQALVGGAVDYAATSLDVAHHRLCQCRRRHPPLRRHRPAAAVRGRHRAEDREHDHRRSRHLEGKTVGVSGARQCRPRADALSAQAGRCRRQQGPVRHLGVNLLEALRQGQIDAGLVQEPALTLLQRAGARVLVNGMDLDDATELSRRHLRVHGRRGARARRFEQRRPEMVALAKALADALKALHTMSGDRLIVAAFPKEMTTGLDLKEFARDPRALPRLALSRHRRPSISTAAKRVAQSLIVGGLLKPDASIDRAARHVDRGELRAARPRPDDFLWRRAGPRRREPRGRATASS